MCSAFVRENAEAGRGPASVASPPPRPKVFEMRAIFLATALAFAVAGGSVNANASVPLPVIEQASGVASLAPVLKRAMPAVVSVAIREGANNAKNASGKSPRVQRTASTPPTERQLRPAGSGVVVDADEGFILTNAHVIEGADEITVAFNDGRELPARRIGADAATDIAVIKVQVDEGQPALSAIRFGNSDGLEVGDFVLALGNPFLIGRTVTSGIVSALHRNNVGIEQYEDFIQTDAAIYPGHSGGPLINLRGELIGINTAFVGAANTNSGMGFAIPVNLARSIAAQIVKYGEVRRTRTGVMF
jgi:S1-C subfamily serine protease